LSAGAKEGSGRLYDLLDHRVEDENDLPFPEPWLEAGKIGRYRIEPITTADDLRDEGDRMHHCVAKYISDVTSGEAYFYHVSKEGERVATVQLTQTTNRFCIEEIKGICNADVSDGVLMAVRRWIALTK
jgi:hypothetical protein